MIFAPYAGNTAVTSRPPGTGYTPYGWNGQQNAVLGGGGGGWRPTSFQPPADQMIRPPMPPGQTLNASPTSYAPANVGALMTPRPPQFSPQPLGQNPQAYLQRPPTAGNPYMDQLQAILARMQGGGFSPYGGMLQQALFNRPPGQGYGGVGGQGVFNRPPGQGY